MLIDYALSAFLRNRARVASSLIGIILGSMLITVIFAMTGDMSGVMARPFSRLYGGQLMLLPNTAAFGRLPSGYLGLKYVDGSWGEAIKLADVEALAADFPLMQEAFIIHDAYDTEGRRTPIVARDFATTGLDFRVRSGRAFGPEDEGRMVVMVNHDRRDNYPVGTEVSLFIPKLDIADDGRIRFDYSLGEPMTFMVIGHYMSPIPTPLTDGAPPIRGPMFLMLNSTYRIIGEVRSDFAMSLLFPDGSRLETERARETFVGYTVMGSEDMAMSIFTGARVREGTHSGLAAVSTSFMWAIFVVSTLIVGLTLVIALRQRTLEFAVLRTQGWKRKHLLGALMLESSLLGLFGGFIGYILGCGLLTSIVAGMGGRIFDLEGIGLVNGLIIAVSLALISMLSGLPSVVKISAIKPAEVIRGAGA